MIPRAQSHAKTADNADLLDGLDGAAYATVAAMNAAIAASVTGLLDFKGATDCSANPNYPVALKGDTYVVSVAGKIGGAAGKSVDIGDMYLATADNAGGTEAIVGGSWTVLEHNLAGALLAENNLSDVANAATARNSLGASAGVWPVAIGGSGTDLSATGGANKYLTQLTAGANFTLADLPNLASVTASLASSYNATASFADSGLSCSLTAGTWIILCLAPCYMAGGAYQGLLKLRNTTDGADVTEEVRTVYTSGADIVGASVLFAFLTITGTKTISLQAKYTVTQIVVLGGSPGSDQGIAKIFALKIAN